MTWMNYPRDPHGILTTSEPDECPRRPGPSMALACLREKHFTCWLCFFILPVVLHFNFASVMDIRCVGKWENMVGDQWRLSLVLNPLAAASALPLLPRKARTPQNKNTSRLDFIWFYLSKNLWEVTRNQQSNMLMYHKPCQSHQHKVIRGMFTYVHHPQVWWLYSWLSHIRITQPGHKVSRRSVAVEVAALSSAILRKQVAQIGCSPPQPARDASHTWCEQDLAKLESREAHQNWIWWEIGL